MSRKARVYFAAAAAAVLVAAVLPASLLVRIGGRIDHGVRQFVYQPV